MPNKTIRSLAASFLIFTLVFLPVSPALIFLQFVRAAHTEDTGWTDYENYIVIDHDTVWSGTMTHAELVKPVVVVNHATLTIEKGAHIEIDALSVYDGRIVAVGTETEPIVFTKPVFDVSTIPPEDSVYDPKCFMPTNGVIEFADLVEADTEEASFFRYVEFNGMGTYLQYDDENCPSMVGEEKQRRSIFNTAYAQSQTKYAPALRFQFGRLKIENSRFINNAYADIEVEMEFYADEPSYDALQVINSNFEGNAQNTALISSIKYGSGVTQDYSHRVLLKNNWYGSPSGPFAASNPDGTGERLIGTFRLDGFSTTKFSSTCTENCYSNVLFLPGLEASRLYNDSNSSCIADKEDPTRAWEPSCNDDARKLYLDAEGKSLDTDIHTKEGDVLDETPIGANIYKSFIAKMDTLKDVDHLINDWKPVAYDWRLSFDDILDDGAIADTLRSLAQNSKTKKVTIVAHSNGGLLAKALMQKLGDEEAKNLIDKIVFVAVPQVGTPSAIAGMLHGYKQNLFPVLDTTTARGLAENMPGAYQLLPSEKYFSSVDTPAVTFDTADSPDWKDRYSDPIHSGNKLHDFLADMYRRVAATDPDTDTPSQLNESLLNNAEDSHDAIDDWMAPDGMKVIQIAGWGVPATLSSIKYDTRKFCDASSCSSSVDLLNPNFDFTLDGDGTVVTPSSLWMNGVERYWVDLKKYNRFVNRLSDGRFLEIDHKDILEIPELDAFIVDSITNNTQPLADYAYLATEAPSFGDEKRLQYSLHSPLTLDLYDDEGRHTGVTSDGNIEERIPGTYYRQFGDVKYIFADESSPLHISLSGYATGTFTFAIKELEGDTPLGTVTFQDMPTTPQTEVTFDISSDLENASDLHIDKDGDGTVDFRLQPKIGEVVTFDDTPPTTAAVLSGTQGTNAWYINDVTLTLSATDNENGSGIEKTEYSLDNGTTWNLYAEPFVISQEGTTAIQYFSTDKQGNKEEIKTLSVKIDRTAPEAKIAFNPTTQKLNITGTDNLSQDISVVTIESAIISVPEPGSNKIKSWFSNWFRKEKNRKIIVTAMLTDEAGHTTEIVFEKKKDKERRIDFALQSIAYDGETTMLSKTLLQYKWQLDRKNQYRLFASQLRTDSTDIESHYIPKKNETWIMERPRELADDDNDDDSERRPIRTKLSGMVIPSMMTEKGIMKIAY